MPLDLPDSEVQAAYREWAGHSAAEIALHTTTGAEPIDLVAFGFKAGYRRGAEDTYDEDEVY